MFREIDAQLIAAPDALKRAGEHAMHRFDRNKSLEQLEGQDWGEPTYDSHLVTECHRLRRVPLREFTTENLRIMIRPDRFALSYSSHV